VEIFSKSRKAEIKKGSPIELPSFMLVAGSRIELETSGL
jgi:hypothetical protein